MPRLEIFVFKRNKNYNFSVAIGLVNLKNSFLKEIEIKDDAKTAVFSLVKKFQKKGTKFSEIVLNGSENYFLKTPLEPYVTVLKKPENFFPNYTELKRLATMIRKDASGLNGSFEEGPESRRELARKTASGEKVPFSGTSGPPRGRTRRLSPVTTGRENAVSRKGLSTARRNTTKQLGDHAENLVAEYLVYKGHKILARNFKTKFYEIDIISTKADKIYFTEVKYRKSEFRGSSLSMITPKKLAQMTFAAESFLKYRKDLKEKYSPLLAAASVSGENFILNDWFFLS